MISVVTCVYNGGKTIADTIESVRNQRYDDYEHLIIEGKSKDNTLEIVKMYMEKDSKIRLYSESDTGIYDAYNKGIKYSRGEYIIFLNADDFFFKDALKNIRDNLSKTEEVFAFDIAMLNEYDQYFKIIRRSEIPRHSVGNPVILTPALVFKKSVFEKLGVFDTGFVISADYDIIARVVNSNLRIKYVGKLITAMREGGMSTNYKFEILKKREHLRVYKRHATPESKMWIFNLFIKLVKALLLNTIFKQRLLKKKRILADTYDVDQVFWFNGQKQF